MAHVVQLVAPSLNFGCHTVLGTISHVISVQISAGLLDGDNFVDEFVRVRAQIRTVTRLKGKARRFRPFVNIGIRKDRSTLRSVALACQSQEIIHTAIGFEQFFHRRDALLYVGLASRSPEPGCDGDGVYRNVSQLCVRRLSKVQYTLILPFTAHGGTRSGREGRRIISGESCQFPER